MPIRDQKPVARPSAVSLDLDDYSQREQTYLLLRQQVKEAGEARQVIRAAIPHNIRYWQNRQANASAYAEYYQAANLEVTVSQPGVLENLGILAALAYVIPETVLPSPVWLPVVGFLAVFWQMQSLSRVKNELQKDAAKHEKAVRTEGPEMLLAANLLLKGRADMYKTFLVRNRSFLAERARRPQPVQAEDGPPPGLRLS